MPTLFPLPPPRTPTADTPPTEHRNCLVAVITRIAQGAFRVISDAFYSAVNFGKRLFTWNWKASMPSSNQEGKKKAVRSFNDRHVDDTTPYVPPRSPPRSSPSTGQSSIPPAPLMPDELKAPVRNQSDGEPESRVFHTKQQKLLPAHSAGTLNAIKTGLSRIRPSIEDSPSSPDNSIGQLVSNPTKSTVDESDFPLHNRGVRVPVSNPSLPSIPLNTGLVEKWQKLKSSPSTTSGESPSSDWTPSPK